MGIVSKYFLNIGDVSDVINSVYDDLAWFSVPSVSVNFNRMKFVDTDKFDVVPKKEYKEQMIKEKEKEIADLKKKIEEIEKEVARLKE